MKKPFFNITKFFNIFKSKNKNVEIKQPEPEKQAQPLRHREIIKSRIKTEPIKQPEIIEPIIVMQEIKNVITKPNSNQQNKHIMKTTFEVTNGLIWIYNSKNELVNQVGTKKQATTIITALEKSEQREFTKLDDYEIKNTNAEVVKQEDGVFGKGKEWFYFFEGKRSEKTYTSKNEAQKDYLNIE